jgi:inner membrane protein
MINCPRKLVDSLTHALAIAIPLVLLGRPDLALYGVLGAVLIDVDVIFSRFSSRDPRLYIFTHGGFTHSFFGALLVTLCAAIPAYCLSAVLPMAPFDPIALLAIGAGALTHVTADYLAYPGIPLFYPISDKKYTLGILGGPSAFIMLASLIYILAMAAGLATIGEPWPYITFFALVIILCAAAKTLVSLKVKGRTIATLNPIKWMVVEELPENYRFYMYNIVRGASPPELYEKYSGLSPADANKYDGPEMRRLRYNSYIVTAEKNGGRVMFKDPLRDKGHIWYPPHYKSLTIAAE